MNEWTIDELRKIEQRYRPMLAADLARQLGRTTPAVRYRAHLLGVRKWFNRQWTAEELSILDAHYADGMDSLAKLLPRRSRSAIRVMLNGRGLMLRGWSAEEMAILREHYPIAGSDCVTLLLRRSKQAIKLAAQRLGIRYRRTVGDGTSALPWSSEEIERLAENQHLQLSELTALFPGRSSIAVKVARQRLRYGRKS